MTKRSIEDARDPDLRGSLPAMRRAAQRARTVARQTGTAIVVWRNDRIEYLRPETDFKDRAVREDGQQPGKDDT